MHHDGGSVLHAVHCTAVTVILLADSLLVTLILVKPPARLTALLHAEQPPLSTTSLCNRSRPQSPRGKQDLTVNPNSVSHVKVRHVHIHDTGCRRCCRFHTLVELCAHQRPSCGPHWATGCTLAFCLLGLQKPSTAPKIHRMGHSSSRPLLPLASQEAPFLPLWWEHPAVGSCGDLHCTAVAQRQSPAD